MSTPRPNRWWNAPARFWRRANERHASFWTDHSCRPRERGDPYSVDKQWGTAHENFKCQRLWVPASAGTTIERLGLRHGNQSIPDDHGPRTNGRAVLQRTHGQP